MKTKLPIHKAKHFSFFIVPEDHRKVMRFRLSNSNIFIVGFFFVVSLLTTVLSTAGLLHYRSLYQKLEGVRLAQGEFARERSEILNELKSLESIVQSAEKYANNLAGMVGIERPELRKGVGPIKELTRDINDFVLPVDFDGLGQEIGRLEGRAKAIDYRLQELSKTQEEKLLYIASRPSIWPVKGWVTSEFGYRHSPVGSGHVFHKGIDIGSQWGSTVVAPAAGIVRYSGFKGALGRAVILDHGYGVHSYYGHASKLLVQNGSLVKRGTPIAQVGSSGHSTGPHLHYEIHVDGVPVDPMQYIIQ